MICLETTTSTAHMNAAADSAGGEPRVRDAISDFWLSGFRLAPYNTPSTALIARDVSFSPLCRPRRFARGRGIAYNRKPIL
jgi:hypothetical protein